MAFDYKKEYKDLYQPKTMPAIVMVPAMRFVAVDGVGNPNEEGGDYAKAMQLLYGISFTVKMSKKSKNPAEHIDGYFDYTVPPLEGLWSMGEGVPGVDYAHKADFHWTSMIRLPEFVTDKVFAWAKASFAAKHPDPTSIAHISSISMKAWSRRSCTRDCTTTSPQPWRFWMTTRARKATSSTSPTPADITKSIYPIHAEQNRKPQNRHPSSGSEGGLTFSELLEALTGRTVLAGFLRMRFSSRAASSAFFRTDQVIVAVFGL